MPAGGFEQKSFKKHPWPGFVRRSVHMLDQRVEVGVGTAECAQVMT